MQITLANSELPAKVELVGLARDELAAQLAADFNLAPFRANQLIQWLHRHGVSSFAEMTDIAKELRLAFAEKYSIYRPKVNQLQLSVDGTKKFLFELEDGSLVESVLIKQEKRNTLCISSQVGCAMGCGFCRTALMGLKRNLSAAEIVGQVLAVKDNLRVEGQGEIKAEDGFSNIVFMGMGEPLHNLPNVARALKILNDDLAHGISQRKITVSTSGLVPAMKRFFAQDLKANLAVSLNATTDEVRDRIMPINKRYPISELLGVLKDAPLNGNKRVTIEYVMLAGVNDTDADLKRLSELIVDIPAKLNLIPYNTNANLGFDTPSHERIMNWQKSLLAKGLNTTIRWSKGEDISAACGQLATASAGKQGKL